MEREYCATWELSYKASHGKKASFSILGSERGKKSVFGLERRSNFISLPFRSSLDAPEHHIPRRLFPEMFHKLSKPFWTVSSLPTIFAVQAELERRIKEEMMKGAFRSRDGSSFSLTSVKPCEPTISAQCARSFEPKVNQVGWNQRTTVTSLAQSPQMLSPIQAQIERAEEERDETCKRDCSILFPCSR